LRVGFRPAPGPCLRASHPPAYEALRGRDYDTAIAGFVKGIKAAPRRASIHKDLAYTYLKIGENAVWPATSLRRAMEIDPNDSQVAMDVRLSVL